MFPPCCCHKKWSLKSFSSTTSVPLGILMCSVQLHTVNFTQSTDQISLYSSMLCSKKCLWEMCKSLLQLLQVVSTSSDSSSDLSDCISTSCSGCLWASIVRTRPFTIRLLSISNFARHLRNIFSPAGSGISVLYGKTVYCKRSTVFVPRIFCPLYTISP